MCVFISYPKKELGYFVTHLAEELKERKIEYFLDEENIGTEIWLRKVKEHIKKADVYVILFLKEAYVEHRIFYEELEKIRESCGENNKKKIIPITFFPESAKDLPIFLRKFNTIETNISGIEQSNSDGFWIRRIADIVENSCIGIFPKLKKHASGISLIILVLLAIFAYHKSTINTLLEELTREKEKVEEKQKKIDELQGIKNGEYVCNSLIGKYKLDHQYTFIEKNSSRTVANENSIWEAKKCDYDKQKNQYKLKGTDTTYFDVEVIINKEYVKIATVKQVYPSEVFIDSEGKLLNRKFNATDLPPDKNIVPNAENKDIVKLTETQIIEKAKEVIRYRNEKHNKLRTKGCDPLLGEKGGKTAIAFVCNHYTRVMERDD